MSNQFRTFQNVKTYEEALDRHAQYVRWIEGILCPCLNQVTRQPDINCSLCHGRGTIYRDMSGPFVINQEQAKHDYHGVVTTKYGDLISEPTVYWQSALLSVGAYSGQTINLDSPYPPACSRVKVNYQFSPKLSILSENSEVVAEKILKTSSSLTTSQGQSFYGAITAVSRVYNVTRDEDYTVSGFRHNLIYLSAMGTWQIGDILEVDYQYVKPYSFIINSVSEKMRYERGYVLPEADAILITPNWARVSPDDVFIALAQQQVASVIVDPRITAGNDIISQFFDISAVERIVDSTGADIAITSVLVENRNEIRWLVAKPALPYSIELRYHPSYRALVSKSSLRNAENKNFVNRVNLKLMDRLSEEIMI